MRLSQVFLGITTQLAVIYAYLETGSYVNPNPQPYDNCATSDRIKLSQCCNDVLVNLDDCKAADLACECCALQKMDRGCYNLCPDNPSAGFLSVLSADCLPLNDVNACNIPFKKVDGEKPSSYRRTNGNDAPVQYSSANVVSTVGETEEESMEEEEMPKPRLNLIKSNTTVEELASISLSFWRSTMVLAITAGVILVVLY